MRALLHLLAALALVAPGLGGTAAAAGWRVGPGLVPPATVERLAERYPDLRNAADLENLLRDLGRRHQVVQLEARFEGGSWVIHGQAATLITDIDIGMVTRLMKQPVYAAVQNYIGQVDSPETRGKIAEISRNYMKRRGYPDSQVRLTDHRTDEGVAYDVRVVEGEPCVIDRVEIPFRMPFGAKLEVAPGDLCDLDEVEQAVSNLETELRDRGYNQVRLEPPSFVFHPGGTATLITPGNLGQKVRYEIVDAAHRFIIDDLFGNDELTKIDPSIVGPDAMAAELSRRYLNRGFLDVAIKGPEIKRVRDDEFVYVYFVDPGKQYILTNVQFEGVTIFKQEELLDFMGLNNLWQATKPFNADEVQQGLTALRGRYQQAGYWDAKVREPGRQKDKETGTVRLTIQVEEGLPRHLRSLQVSGNHALTTDEIRELQGVPPDAPLDRGKLVDFQQAVRSAYVARGYLYADVQIDLKATDARKAQMVDVLVTVNEGSRVKIGDVTVLGLVRTHEKVVRRELLFQRGDWYEPEKIGQSRTALTRLGLFRSVQITPADRNALADKERELDLIVDVREGKAGNVSFGPGWSLVKGWNYGAEASYNNIGGVGRQASVRGSISEEKDQYAIGPRTLVGRKIGAGYVEPYIFDLPVDASINANQSAEWGGQLWDLSYGGEVALTHKLRLLLPGSTVSVFYGQKIAKTEGSSQQEEEQVASDVRIGRTGVRFNLDLRDNLKFPTTGYTISTEQAWARYELGGDLRYFRWEVASSVYFGVVENLVFALGINLTSYEDIQRKGNRLGILPPSERLASGGADTVRGYPTNSLGPVVKAPLYKATDCAPNYQTTPLDGSTRTTIKTELRRKLSDTLAVTGFVDNGNVFLSRDQMSKFQEAYSPVANPKNPQCPKGQRTVEDNYSYAYGELAKNPGYLWTKHYWSYGSTLNLLTALGSVNLGYGLPWREPKSEQCEVQDQECNIRARQMGAWWQRGEFILNVGAHF